MTGVLPKFLIFHVFRVLLVPTTNGIQKWLCVFLLPLNFIAGQPSSMPPIC